MNKKLITGLTMGISLPLITACGDADETGQENTGAPENNTQTEEAPADDETAMGEPGGEAEMPEPDLEGVPDVVAEVNGEEIDREEFEVTYEGQFMQAAQQSMMMGQEVDQDELKQQTAESMVSTELLIQEAENSGYDATEEEVNETIDEVAQQNGMSQDEFLAALEEQGTEQDEIMDQVETQVKIDQLIASEAGDVEPTEEELEQAYEQMKEQQEQMAEMEGGEQEVPEFEEVRPELEEQLKMQKEGEAAQELVDELRDEADVTIHL